MNDHEPEFISLKREVQILCDGPPSIEATYFDKVTPLCMDDCPVGRDLSRPGQKEQIEIIIDYERRLVLLRKELDGQSAGLSSQLEKAKEFESLTSGLTVWLGDVEGGLGKLKIRDPNSGVIRPQLQKCQVCCTEYGTVFMLDVKQQQQYIQQQNCNTNYSNNKPQ